MCVCVFPSLSVCIFNKCQNKSKTLLKLRCRSLLWRLALSLLCSGALRSSLSLFELPPLYTIVMAQVVQKGCPLPTAYRLQGQLCDATLQLRAALMGMPQSSSPKQFPQQSWHPMAPATSPCAPHQWPHVIPSSTAQGPQTLPDLHLQGAHHDGGLHPDP